MVTVLPACQHKACVEHVQTCRTPAIAVLHVKHSISVLGWVTYPSFKMITALPESTNMVDGLIDQLIDRSIDRLVVGSID